MTAFDKKTVAAAEWAIWDTPLTAAPANAAAYESLGTFVAVGSTVTLPPMGDDENSISIITIDDTREYSQHSTLKGKEGTLSYLLADSDAGQADLAALVRGKNYAIRVTLNDATAATTATKLYQFGQIGPVGLPLGDNTAFVICEQSVKWNGPLIITPPAAV